MQVWPVADLNQPNEHATHDRPPYPATHEQFASEMKLVGSTSEKGKSESLMNREDNIVQQSTERCTVRLFLRAQCDFWRDCRPKYAVVCFR